MTRDVLVKEIPSPTKLREPLLSRALSPQLLTASLTMGGYKLSSKIPTAKSVEVQTV